MSRRAVLIAALAALALSAAAPAAAPGALVHRWPGDGTADDVVGTANGTLGGGLGFAPALFGQGFAFDGVDDDVSFPALPADSPGTADFTVAFAIRTTMPSTTQFAVLSKRPVCNATQPFWDVRSGGGHLTMEIYGTAFENLGGSSAVQINDGVFHTIVIVRAGTSTTFYVDGGPGEPTTHSTVADVANATPFRAALSPCVGLDGTAPLAGTLDDIRYANGADPGLLPPPAPVALAPPAIPASGTSGAAVTCPDGTWRYHPTGFTRQWLRDGTPIDGATGTSYTLTPADAGHAIACRVTASNAGGSGSADSNALAAAAAPTTPPAVTPPATTPPAPVRVAVERLATLPSAKACVSRRAFPIRLRGVKANKVVRAQIKLNGATVRTVKGKALGLPVNLRGLPKGRFVVEIVTTDAAGKRLVGRRTYRTCVPKRR